MVITTHDFPDSAFRALVQAAPDGVLVVGHDGRILLANPEIRRMTGFDAEDLLGQPLEVLVPPEYRPRHVSHRADFVERPRGRPMGAHLELWAMCKDGSKLAVEIMLAPMVIEGIGATVAFVRDATDRRRRQRELEAAHAAASAAVRELEAFSYSVAHDLRAPLRSIDGFSQALFEDHAAALDTEARDYLERVRAAAQRMGLLIDDLLALARLSRTELRRGAVDLARLAREIDARLRQAHPDRAVEVTIDEPLTATGDARLLAIALDNLLGNAWKFTRTREVGHVHVGRVAGPDGPAYVVRDDGVGFDMAYASSLFAPFKRLHSTREFEGTGIGLATVARVIHRHGGRVWAEAEPGRGASFYFTLGPEEDA